MIDDLMSSDSQTLHASVLPTPAASGRTGPDMSWCRKAERRHQAGLGIREDERRLMQLRHGLHQR